MVRNTAAIFWKMQRNIELIFRINSFNFRKYFITCCREFIRFRIIIINVFYSHWLYIVKYVYHNSIHINKLVHS